MLTQVSSTEASVLSMIGSLGRKSMPTTPAKDIIESRSQRPPPLKRLRFIVETECVGETLVEITDRCA